MSKKELFHPLVNCWRTNVAHHAALVVDCANFYRAFHEVALKAKHSLFILGWEIDSGVRLLRGEEEKQATTPTIAVELLAYIAEQNPHLQIYLLRWDSSVVFIGEREMLAEYVWSSKTPENVHICLDNTIPIGGSHHQKVVLIDDELVFSGGMDLARQRWDERSHKIDEPERNDANGPYGPYHDLQIVMDGPIALDFAELVRLRWRQAAGYEPVPIRRSPMAEGLVPSWPSITPPLFKNISLAVARTIPQIGNAGPVQEVRQMYFDLIWQAEDFIYIENQFIAYEPFARAINKRMKDCPPLKALIIGSYNPQGIFESEALWTARINFKNILEEGLEENRVKMVCSGIEDDQNQMHYKRIHSKVLVIDDQYLVVGSANINNRSMAVDTECDVILKATTDEQHQNILFSRNDLIAEHCGRSVEEVQQILEQEDALLEICKSAGKGKYGLRNLEDEKFTSKKFEAIARTLADPEKTLSPLPPVLSDEKVVIRNPHRKVFIIAGLVFVALWILLIFLQRHWEWFHPDTLRSFMQESRNSVWGIFLVCGVYLVGGVILFPVTVMSLMTAAIFGPILGPIYGMAGALLSAAVMFQVGRWAGIRGLRGLFGSRVKKVDHHFQKAGVVGVAALRLLPIAPYSIVNLAAGISSVRFMDFMLGSFLGFLPASVAKGLVGDSLTQVFLDPTLKTGLYLCLGLVVWIVLMTLSYRWAKRWQKRHTP